MYVKFKGDRKQIARLAILASIPELEDVSIKDIHNPGWVHYWNYKGKSHLVNLFCALGAIVHPITGNLRRPWAVKYPTALSIVEAAGLEVISQMSLKDYHARITMD